MVNIKEIAKHAGVSVATVSHVINKTRFVSVELTAKVENAMKELDYRPNMVASSLRSRKTRTIGLIIPDSSNIVFSGIGQAIEAECRKDRQNVIFCNSSYDVEAELKNIEILRSKMVDGILILPATNRTDSIEKLLSLKMPFVVVNADITYPNVDIVYVNNAEATYMLTNHMLEIGCQRICYIDRSLDHHYSLARRKGFTRALEEKGIKWDNELYIRSSGFYYEHGYQVMEDRIKKDISFDSVIAYNDVHAIGALRALADYNFKVPEEIKIAGFDDIPVSRFIKPSLTSVYYPNKNLGHESYRLLMEQIDSPGRVCVKLQVNANIVIRESTELKNE